MIKQNKFASMVDSSTSAYLNSDTPPTYVRDSQSYGLIFSMNQKLGHHSGVKIFWEQFGFSAIGKSNSLKIKASPVRMGVISFYTNIDRWHMDNKR